MIGEQMAIDFTPVANMAQQGLSRVFAPFVGTRSADPVTSHEAEAKVRPHASHGRRLVLAALAVRPATDFELAEVTGWQQTSIGKRRGECVALGWVEAFTAPDGTKCKRPSPSGSPAIVWRLTPSGGLALEKAKEVMREEMKGGEA